MRRLIGFMPALAIWSTSAWAVPTWTAHGGPGGGGNFTCVDVSSGGRVLVGSDVSGLYGRNGNTGNWTRMGELDGLRATQILDVQFSSTNPTHVLCGTGNGAYYSTNSGQSWSEVNVQDYSTSYLTYHKNVDAVGFGNTNADTTLAIVAWREGFTINLATGTWGFGAGLGALTKLSTTITDSSDARILKIVFDPGAGSGSNRSYYLLVGTGLGNSGSTNKRIYYTTNNGSSFSRIVDVYVNNTNYRVYPVDIAISESGRNVMVTTTVSDETITDSADKHEARRGNVYTCVAGTWTWTEQSLADNCAGCIAANITKYPTGACWWSGSDAYVLTVGRDPCYNCSSNTDSCTAGLWRFQGGSWLRIDDGKGNKSGTATWDAGWTTCNLARGPTIECNVPGSVSPTTPALYWVTAMYVWWYDTSGNRKYANAFTSGESSPWTSKRIDNVNPVAITVDAGSPAAPWVGYYDIGLWKLTSSGWENKNDSSWNGGKGGNVSSIVFDGSNIHVLEAPSSKTNQWAVWKSVNSGSSWTQLAGYGATGGGLPTSEVVFLNSLVHSPGTSSRWWVSANHRLYKASDPSSWSAVTNPGTGAYVLPDTGIMVVTDPGTGTVLAGGWSGVFRSDDGGVHWATVSGITKPTPTCKKSRPDEGNAYYPQSQGSEPKSLHKRLWYGAHQIVRDPDSGDWYVVMFCPVEGLDSGSRGIYRSTDDGQSWTQMSDSCLRRGIAVDSCGFRVHITSGLAFTAGNNSDDDMANATGEAVARLCPSGCTFAGYVPEIASNGTRDPLFGYMAGHGMATWDDPSCWTTTLYMLVPGYGLMSHTAPMNPSTACETQLTGGGGGGMTARHAREETAPLIGRRTFTLAEARGKVFFDLSGRRVEVKHPGVYFDPVIKDGRVVTRRTVLVTP